MTQFGANEKLVGMVDEITGVRTGNGAKGLWQLTKFTLRKQDGEKISAQTFDETFTTDLVGKWIGFDAKYTAKYKSYDMVGTYTVVPSPVPTPAATTTTATPAPAVAAKPGRPRRIPATTTGPANGFMEHEQPLKSSYAVNPPAPGAVEAAKEKQDPREALRTQAEQSTKKDLESALRLSRELGLQANDIAGVVALADRVGRTITAIGLDNRR